MAEDKKKGPKKVSEQERKRLAAQQETINNQKKIARDQSIDLMDNVCAQVALTREDHVKVQRARDTIKASNLELEAYEKAQKLPEQEETEDGEESATE